MGAVKFDTSGAVLVPHRTPEDAAGRWASDPVQWSDLSPFTQGYIEALFAENYPALHEAAWQRLILPPAHVRVAFSDLAPETLARIIADCGLACREGDGRMEGIDYWNRRQAGEYLTTRPPLTVQLGDDGKVRFADATGETV